MLAITSVYRIVPPNPDRRNPLVLPRNVEQSCRLLPQIGSVPPYHRLLTIPIKPVRQLSRGPAAIDEEIATGDERGFIAGKEIDGGSDFRGIGPAAEGCSASRFFLTASNAARAVLRLSMSMSPRSIGVSTDPGLTELMRML